MKAKKEKVIRRRNEPLLTFFVLALPIVLLAFISGNNVEQWIIKITLVIYELVILKNFIEDYHKYKLK